MRRLLWAALALAGVALVLSACAKAGDIPAWVRWEEREIAQDVDGDGVDELVRLADRRVEVRRGGELVSESEPSWLVSDVCVGDVDGDGACEITLLGWREGVYGTSHPFWVDTSDDTALAQHVFVTRLEDGALKPEWVSSSFGLDIASLELVDGALSICEPDGTRSHWVWESWGFARRDEDREEEADEPESAGTFTLLIVGDNIIHEGIYEEAYDAGTKTFDFVPCYEQVAPWVSSFDLAVVTQETPFVEDAASVSGYPVFGTPDAVADALAGAGFDVACHATNHANDQGVEGIAHTLATWEERHPEVEVLGIHDTREDAAKTRYVSCQGATVAFVDYTYGLNGLALPEGEEWRVDTLLDEESIVRLERRVASARKEADVVVCVLHVGEEYDASVSEEQRALEERIANAGADVIACSHAHVLLPAERIERDDGKGTVVYHGLGNFLSYQTDPATTLGGAACLTFEADGEGSWSLADATLEGVVCHLSTTGAVAYRLCDYTEELAGTHYLNTHGEGEVTVQALEEQRAQADLL